MRTTRARAATLLAAALFCAGCGGRRARSGDDPAGDRHTLRHAGRTRSYILRLPASIPPGTRAPLVIVLHGGGGNGAGAEVMTGFTAKARAEGFVVAYPDGSARGRLSLLTWNAGHCCGYAMEAGIDDVGFLAALIDELVRRHPIDARRVYVTGMSNGAMLAHRAGIEIPERLAAIAPVVGGVFGDERARTGGVSALMINGMLDRSVPYAGGAPGGRFPDSWDGTPVRPALEQARFWAAANGCRATPAVTEWPAYLHVRHACPAGTAVELYAVKDNGHAWPGGERGSARGDVPSTSLDATAVIWSFFAAHPKRER